MIKLTIRWYDGNCNTNQLQRIFVWRTILILQKEYHDALDGRDGKILFAYNIVLIKKLHSRVGNKLYQVLDLSAKYSTCWISWQPVRRSWCNLDLTMHLVIWTLLLSPSDGTYYGLVWLLSHQWGVIEWGKILCDRHFHDGRRDRSEKLYQVLLQT